MKKRTLIIQTLLCIATSIYADNKDSETGATPSISENYIHVSTPTISISTNSHFNVDNSLQTIKYFDGLGRPIEEVHWKVTPQKNDQITFQEYDLYGRITNSWLPTTSEADGAFVEQAAIIAEGRAVYSDNDSYSKTVYEASPLNRITEQYGPGSDWHNNKKKIKTEYLVNNNSYVCRWYRTTDTRTSVQINITSGKINYPAGELFVTRTTDEDEQSTILEFRDKHGKVLLTRQTNGTIAHNTYFVYDSYDNVRAVLPPLASDALTATGINWTDTTTVLANYAYLYKYDNRNRMIAKKLPGAEWIYYVYDHADRLIFTQDGETRLQGKWTFSIPDDLNRTVLTGTCTNSMSYTTNPLSNTVVKATRNNTTGTYKGYAVSGVTLSSPVILSANYYDDYNFMGKNSIPDSTNVNFKYEAVSGYGTRYTTSSKGLLTGTLNAQVNQNGITTSFLYSVMYYDYRDRMIQMKSNNHLTGGIEKEYTGYTFTGKPKQKKHIHIATGKDTQTEFYTYTYDHAERLKKVEHQLQVKNTLNAKVTLAEHTYDDLGRLQTKKPHGSTVNPVTYTYNIRNWTTGISSKKFTQNLYYNTGNGAAQYNGNISSMTWKAGTESTLRGYKFVYDKMNRLKEANYGEGNNIASNINRFNEKVTEYDKHGNIMKIQRYGKTSSSAYGLIDNLSFGYNGNQMKYVNDAVTTNPVGQTFQFINGSNSTGDEFAYDANGNMIKDNNKNITGIQYNILNLPKKVQLSGSRSATYLYDAAGVKHQVTHQGGGVSKTTDYCGNVIYENGVLSKILTEEGYITLSGTTPTYHYYLKDHLGNNRVVLHQNGSTVEQVNHYYPFGGLFDQTAETLQAYKYNGKELDRTYGIDLYDYSARYMDGALGRFTTIDPMAEKYYGVSPYAYCNNNPMRYVDPTGEDWRDFFGGIANEAKNGVAAIGYAVTHPIDALQQTYTGFMKKTLNEKIASIADLYAMGAISKNREFFSAVASDLNGGDGSATGKVLGGTAVDVAAAGAGVGIGKVVGSLGKGQSLITNNIPKKLARVIPGDMKTLTLGAPNQADVFVTAANDIKGLNASQIATRLTIPESSSGFQIIEFKTPLNGISSPVNRSNPGFVGRGRTAGGAREFTIPNQPIPQNSKIKIIK